MAGTVTQPAYPRYHTWACRWTPFQWPAVQLTPMTIGVYSIRWAPHSKGQATRPRMLMFGKGLIRQRLGDFYRAVQPGFTGNIDNEHYEAWRYVRYQWFDVFPPQHLQFQYLCTATEQDAFHEEWVRLTQYYLRYARLPVLNASHGNYPGSEAEWKIELTQLIQAARARQLTRSLNRYLNTARIKRS